MILVSRALAGVVFGAAIGLLLLEIQTIALLAAAVAFVWSLSSPSRWLALGSLLLGAGACWLLLIAIHVANPCAQTATTSCASPDLFPLAVFAVVVISVGSLLILGGVRTAKTAE
ncbi:MAG: hypothetical protein ABSA21_06100 [Candidatus Limnocylindrales bacterium]|jgi:hypothetical protein